MSKTSIALLLIFLITLTTLLVLNTTYSSNAMLTSFPNIFPTQSVNSENILSLTPNKFTAQPGKTTTVQVTIDSRGLKPSLIQLELAYDPAVIRSVKVLPGTFYQNPDVRLNTVNARIGRISYALAPTQGYENTTATNVVATLQITPNLNVTKRETTITFMPKTVIHTSATKNALQAAFGTTITFQSIKAPNISPTATIIPEEPSLLPTAF